MKTKQSDPGETKTEKRTTRGLSLTVATTAAIVLGLIAYGETLLRAARTWSSNADEQHGFFVIPLTLLLLYLRRSEFPWGTARLDPRGLLLLAVAAGMKIYSAHHLRPWMDMWSLPVWVAGVVWLLGGMKIFRWAAPVIAFLFFMAALPGQIQTAAGYPLQVTAANGAGWTLQALGQPGFVAGTTILLGEHTLDVEHACAGLRMFQGMFAVGFAWSLFCRYSWPRFLFTMAIAPLIAIFVNILRIVATGLLFQWAGTESAETFAHDWAGVVMIPAGAMIFFLVQGVTDRMIDWHRERPERRLVTAMVAVTACLLLAAGGYAMHAQQQRRAIGLVLGQARELSRSGRKEDQVQAVAYYQRYLSLRGTDADVISELAELNGQMGGEREETAARLHELAWRQDSGRQKDALRALVLLQRLEQWRRLWDRSEAMLPSLSGDVRVAAMRLRTAAVGNLTRFSSLGSDMEKVARACREGVENDAGHFEHMWQLALLTRAHPALWRESDAIPRSGSGVEKTTSAYLGYAAGGSSLPPSNAETDLQQVLSELLEADQRAMSIVDRCIAEKPHEPRPLLYRAALLESAMTEVRDESQRTEIARVASESLDKALVLVEQNLLAAESNSDDDDLPLPAQGEQSTSSDRAATAAIAYQMAGERALDRGDMAAAKNNLLRSQQLNPANHRIYLSLSRTIPPEASDERIELFEQAVKACGWSELTLVLPLAESYMSVGRQADAEAILQPLERLLPRLERTDRGRIELMLASTRASGLVTQQQNREAAELLASALRSPSVASQRRHFTSLYAQAQSQLGSLYRVLGQEAAAAAAFGEGGRADPESPIWNLDAGRAYEATGNLTEALKYYERATLTIGQQQPSVYLAIARVLLAQQRELPRPRRDLKSARSMISVAAERGADTGLTTAMMAETYVMEEDLDGAMRVLDRQLKATPNVPQIRFSRAMIYQLSGDVEAAIEESKRYQQSGATAAESLLLRVLIYQRAGQSDAAANAIAEASQQLSDDELKVARTQLVIGLLAEGQIDQGVSQLRRLAASHPNNFSVQRLAAKVFGDLRMEDAVETAERNLKELEGSEGTTWRAVRAARLLRIARQTEESSQARVLTSEATDLIRRLQQLLPDWPETFRLQGLLAENAGRWPEALAAYQSEWSVGAQDAELASRILNALNRSGQSQRVADFVSQLEMLVPRSTSLFDRAMPEYVRGNRADFVLQLARRWTEEDPTSENLVRLGQTLMAIVGSGRVPASMESKNYVDRAIAEAEDVLATAIEKDATNLDAWIAIFQLHADIQEDRQGALDKLRELSDQVSIEPLQKSFVLAQAYAAMGENARAGELYDRSVQLAEQASPEVRQKVMLTAVEFLSSRRIEDAVALCRRLLSESPTELLAKKYLVRLLAMQRTRASVNEAIGLQQQLLASSSSAEVEPSRMLARLLAIRAELDPSSSRDRSEAIALLESISPRTATDAGMIAELYSANDQPLRAFNFHRETLRLEMPTPERLIRVLDFWNDAYASSGSYHPLADQYLDELATYPNAASEWLRLSLERLELEQASMTSPTDEETSTSDSAAVDVESTADGVVAIAEQNLLDRFIENFLHQSTNPAFESPLVEMLEGLSAARRNDMIPEALRRFAGSRGQSVSLAQPLALAILRLAGDSDTVQVLVDEARKLAGPDSGQSAEALVLLGDAMYVTGLPDLAVPYYRKAIEQSPDNLDARNNLAIVLAESDPGNEESVNLIKQLIEAEPESAEHRDTMLVIAMLREDWETADSVADDLASEYSGTILLHRAYLRLKQGQLSEAREWFARSRDDNVEDQLIAPADKRMFDLLNEQFVSQSRPSSVELHE